MLTINPKIFTKASLFLLSLLLSATLWAQDIHQLKTLANKGDSEAQFELGVIYDNGDQLPQDLKKAAYWYTKSAQQGHVDAQYNIGDMYRTGDGVTQDYGQAVQWLSKAADQGSIEAQNDLGYLYMEGIGVPQDYRKAFELLS